MKSTFIFKILRTFIYQSIQLVARGLPHWKHAETVPVYPPMLQVLVQQPLNLAQLPASFARHFIARKHIPARQIFILRNVLVSGEAVVFKNFRIFIPSLTWLRDLVYHNKGKLLVQQWRSPASPFKKSEEVALVYDQWSAENYYHWMIESLPRLLLVKKAYPNCRVLYPEPAPDFVGASLKRLGIQHLHPLPRHQASALRVPTLLLPELVYYEETEEALPRVPIKQPLEKVPAEELIVQVRRELLAAQKTTPPPSRRIYASRATQKTRRLSNEAEVLQILDKWGFERLFFENLCFEEQLELMQQTEVFLGLHGANMVNLLFLPAGTPVIEMMNQEHFNEAYYLLASSLQLPYYAVPCQMTDANLSKAEDPVLKNDADVRVDPNELEQAVRACLQKLEENKALS